MKERGIGSNMYNTIIEFITGNLTPITDAISAMGTPVTAIIALRFFYQRYKAEQQDRREDRFLKAVEMLGNSESITSRTGAIQAIQWLMQRYPEEFHIRGVDVLCDFIRNPVEDESAWKSIRNHPFLQGTTDIKVENPPDIKKRLDVQKAIDVIGWRTDHDLYGHAARYIEENSGEFIELGLAETDLRGYEFKSGGDFSTAQITESNLSYALWAYGVKLPHNIRQIPAHLSIGMCIEDDEIDVLSPSEAYIRLTSSAKELLNEGRPYIKIM